MELIAALCLLIFIFFNLYFTIVVMGILALLRLPHYLAQQQEVGSFVSLNAHGLVLYFLAFMI